jgi:hypothetical protein
MVLDGNAQVADSVQLKLESARSTAREGERGRLTIPKALLSCDILEKWQEWRGK